MADFIIFLRPDEIAFTCPHCEAYVEIPWGDVEDEAPDDWGGGDWPDVVCPECRGQVSLADDPLMWKKVPRSKRWEEKHDLISRKAAIDAILAEPPDAPQSWYEGVIRNLPAADVEPVRHGEWEPCSEDYRQQIEGNKCSACGFEYYGTGPRRFSFCPGCRVKMDGGENDDN